MKQKLPWAMVLVGIMVLVFPTAAEFYSVEKQKALIENFEVQIKKTTSTPTLISATSTPSTSVSPTPDFSIPTSPPISNTETFSTPASLSISTSKVEKLDSDTILGMIKIEKIKLYYPIMEGVSREKLRQGIGHIPGTALAGEKGNFVLAGHRNSLLSKFFRRLDELESGDEVQIIIKDKLKKEVIIHYKVYEKRVVQPEDISVLESDFHQAILTMITCHPVFVANQRLVVKAELKE